MSLFKKSIVKDPEKPNRQIKMSIYYTKGRGYWASVTPVTVSESHGFQIESSGLFDGFTDKLLVVERASLKRLQEAIAIFHQREADYIAKFDQNSNLIKQ